jgi:antitoxin component YwqK of YwqJK toxin-antitoxin module
MQVYAQKMDTLRSFWPKGNIKSEEVNKSGPGWGYTATWYENGVQASNYTFYNGARFCYGFSKYENGNLKQEQIITVVEVIPDIDTNTGLVSSESVYWSGRYIEHFNNGNVSSDGHYLEGKKEGKWTFYDSSGELLRRAWYENGKVVSFENYASMSK